MVNNVSKEGRENLGKKGHKIVAVEHGEDYAEK